MPKITERPVPPEDLLRRAHEALDAGRFDLAEEALAKDEFDIAALIENLRIYQAELEIQNQELQASRVEVERALARFAAFFETLPMAELIVDGKGVVLEVNAAAEALFELGVQHLRQQFFSRLVVAADRGVAVGAFATAWEAGRAALLEVGFRKTTGEDFIGDLHIARLPGEPGGARQFVCAIVDQSEAVRQRQALRERAEELGRSRAELRERIKELRCLYDVVKLELQPGLAVAEFLERIVARLPSAMQAPTLAAACIELSGHAIASPGFAPTEPMLEVPIALPDGGEGRVQVVYAATDEAASPAFLAEERHLLEAVAGHVASFLRRQAAEEDLSQTRESYRILAEYSPDWEYWLGPEGRYLYLSPACEALTGWPPAAFEADPDLFARLIHPADRPGYLAHRDEVLAGGARAHRDDAGHLELRLQTRSGEWRWFEHYCVSVVGADGQWRGRRGVNRDITARKQAEAEVARMTRLYATLSATNQAIVRVESEAELLPEFCRIAVQEGGLAACLVSRPRGEAGRFATVAAAYSQTRVGDGRGDASAGGPGWPKSGVSFPLLIGGAMAGVATFYAPEPDFFARDVVELLDEMSRDLAFALDRFAQGGARVLAEQGLRVRERQLAAIFRAAPIGIGLIKHRQILQGNDYLFEMFGYAPGELIGQDARQLYADEAEYERVGRTLYADIAARGIGVVEATMRRRDGERIFMQASVASLDSVAHPGVMVFTAVDITERHRQEEALLRSRWRLEQAERLANVGAWEIDVAARRLTPSAQWRRIHGTDAEDLGLDALIATHAHPEDRPALERAMHQVLAGEGRYDLEHRIVRADDGQVRTIHAIGEAERDPDGRPIRVYGAALDVTERRRAEEERLARERELAAIFRAAPIGIGLTRARRILRVNDYLARVLGYEPAELIGQDARLVYPSDEEYERVGREKYRQLAATGSGTVETRWLARDGRQLDVLLSSSLVDAADPTGAAVFTALDITERKRAEAALQASEERLRLVMAATNDALVDWDVGSGRLTVNDRFFEQLGFDPGGFAPTFEWILARVHPEDQGRVLRELEAGMAGDEPFAVEGRIGARTGDWLWVQSRGQVVARDGAGRPMRVAGTMTDVTASRRAEAALRESHRRLTEAERLARLGHWEYDLASGQPVWSEQVYRIFGLDPDCPPPLANEHGRLFHAEDLEEYRRLLDRTIETGEPFAFVLRVWRRDGALRWLSATGHLERTVDGRPRRLFGTAQDVTEQHDAAERLRQAAQVFESTADGVIVTDAAARILAVNRAFTEITGYTEAEALGETPRLLKSGRHDQAFYQALWASLRRTGSWRGELWNRRKDGELYPELLTISAVPGRDGAVSHYVAVFSDLTSVKRSEEQLEHLAHHDPLTELPNRALFRTRLAHGLQRAERDRRRLGVLVMDLDRFKVINDSMGPASGDEALRQIGASLTEALRPGDTLARLGGDEFGLILEDLGDPSVAVATAQRLMALCARPRQLGGREVTVTACVGIGLYPGDGDDGESLLRHADVALSQAKAQGPQTLQFFEPAMERGVVERLHLEGCLRQALAAGELRLHYQPQVRLADGSLIGAEALLRWRSAELGEVPPGRFIPLAEEIGLIDEIGAWVLRQGCEQLRAWDAAGLHLPRLAINLSIRQLEAGDLIERCDRTFRETGVAPERIELEVTESMVMRRADLSVEVLNGLRDLGVRLVIDDFGTGYSSLAYLRRLPLHQLKIDKSFVDDLLDDANSQAIARAIIALGHSLGLEVLAEGVEEADQAQRLRLDGCDLAQGYHFARPLPVDEFAEHWLR